MAKLGDPVDVAAAESRADIAHEHIEKIGDRTALERDPAVHIGLSQLKLRVAHQIESHAPVVQAHRQRLDGPIAECLPPSRMVDENEMTRFHDASEDGRQ